MRLVWCLRERVIPPDDAVMPAGWDAARIARVLYNEQQEQPAAPEGGLPVGGTPEKCQGKSIAVFAVAPLTLPTSQLAWLLLATREAVGVVEPLVVRITPNQPIAVDPDPPRHAMV